MARIRTIKPELGAHEGLFDLERETSLPIRFAWCMLFTVADREGRFAWRPRTLKAQILPHDEVEFSRVLDAWLTRGFVRKYRVGSEWFGWIPTFTRHQVINNREGSSELPSIDEADEEYQPLTDASPTREARETDASPTRAVHAQGEGKGRKEGKGREGNSASFDATSVVGLDQKSWQRWVGYRREIGKAIKPPSMAAAANEMAKLGDGQAAAVQFSIANSYQGLIEPKRPNGVHSGARRISVPKSADQLEAEARARGEDPYARC
jgi:hypothetical protein